MSSREAICHLLNPAATAKSFFRQDFPFQVNLRRERNSWENLWEKLLKRTFI